MLNYKVETVSLKSLATEQAARNRAKYSDAPPENKTKRSALLKFGDGDGSWFDRFLTQPMMPEISSFSKGYKQPTSGFKREAGNKLAESIKRGQKLREIDGIKPSDAERKLLEKEFVSDSSEKSGSDTESSASDIDDDDDDDDNAGKNWDEKHGGITTTVILPKLPLNQKTTVESQTPRTRKYIGKNARRRFFRRFQKEWKDQQKRDILRGRDPAKGGLMMGTTEKELLLGTTKPANKELAPLDFTSLGSARAKFLKRCARENLPPQPCLVRKFKSDELNLSGMLLGDQIGLALAEAIPSIPNVEELDLSTNRMTGLSISKMLNAIEFSDILRSLNLSGNRLGFKGMDSLMSFLAKTSCLESLELEKTKSGDEQARILCQGLCKNKTVTFLNVANNQFGERAGHYFAKMLRRIPSVEDYDEKKKKIISSDCILTNLDLSWNQIRTTGAEAMGKAFIYNDQLNTLDLSYCAFGDHGTSVLMDSLRTNTTLTWLELDNNAIKGRGSFVTAFCLEQNTSLKYLQLWENPIGKHGGRALLRSVSRTGDVREMQLDKCNFEIIENGIFDPEQPPSSLILNLEKMYDRAVATELFRVIQKRPGIQVTKLTLDNSEIRYEQFEPEDLPGYEEAEEEEEEEEEDEEEDNSNNNNNNNNNKDQQQHNFYTSNDPATLLFLCDGRAFDIPSEGILHIECTCEPRRPAKHVHVSNEGLRGMMSIIFGQEESTMREITLRLETAMCDAYVTALQAKILLKKFIERSDKRIAAEYIVPKLNNSNKKFWVLQNNLHTKDIAMLEKKMGIGFHFTPNNPTGRYILNLETEHDRNVAKSLFHQNNDDIRWSKNSSGRNDTSEYGNWSGIRNATYRNQKIIPDATWSANGLPTEGMLQMDYVSCRTPPKAAKKLVMTSSRFKTFCVDLDLRLGKENFFFLIYY